VGTNRNSKNTAEGDPAVFFVCHKKAQKPLRWAITQGCKKIHIIFVLSAN